MKVASRRPTVVPLLLGCLITIVAAPALGSLSGAGTPTALMPLAGQAESFALDINDADNVVGESANPGLLAVLWDEDGNATLLPPLPGDLQSSAQSINNRGDVAGYSRSKAGPCGNTTAADTAVIWRKNGTMTTLPPLPGDFEARAFHISNAGEVIGTSLSARFPNCSATFTVVKWDKVGVPSTMGTTGAPESFGNGINSQGSSVGGDLVFGVPGGFLETPILWDKFGNPTFLPFLPTGRGASLQDISSNGLIAGRLFGSSGSLNRGGMWDKAGNLTILDPRVGEQRSFARGINASGLAVGESRAFNGIDTAVVWDKDGVIVASLPPLLGDAESFARKINSQGHVVGFSKSPGATGFIDTAVIWK